MKYFKIVEFKHRQLLQLLVLWCAFLLPLVPGVAQAQALEYVVFSIDGPIDNLSLGQILNEGDRIQVPKNTTLNLISKRGDIVTLEGPTTATVTTESQDESGETALVSISSLLFVDSKFVKVLGGTRSTDNETDVQQLLLGQTTKQAWLPTFSESKNYCVKRENIAIRRSTANEDIILSEEAVSGIEEIRWETGSYILDLSKQLAGKADTHSLNIGSDGNKIALFVSDNKNSTLAEQVAWMANKGCFNQALLLLASKVPVKE